MRAVRLVRQHLHARGVAQPDDLLEVRADTVIGRVVDQDRFGGGVLLDRVLHVRNRHTQRDTQPVVHLRIDVNRDRAGEHERVYDRTVHVAGQDDLIPAFDDRQHHRLYARGRAADHEEGVRRAESLGGELLRLADDADRVAQVVQRLHGVDVHGHALFAEEFGQFGVAAPALVSGDIKRDDTHIFKVFERLFDRRTGLIHKQIPSSSE